jgi:2-polyprenyl-6-methoxyphenol hydroxylase-like FAD-dependent oxidoreductase
MRVIIVGGGIGGLTAAVALQRVGIQPLVFERAPELREVGAGLTLWTNAVRVLRTLGLGDAVAEIGVPLRESELRAWDGGLISGLDLGAIGDKFGAPTLGVHRAELQRVLSEKVGPALALGAACVEYAVDADGVTVRFADGRTQRGDILIGADGLRSVVRGQVLGVQKPRYAGYTAWRGVGRIDRPEVPTGVTLLALGRGSQFGYLPIGGGRTYWFATANCPANMYDPPGTAKPNLLKRFADWYPPIPAVIEATDATAVFRSDILDRPPVTPWGVGRVTLLGDAAHPTTPNLGQGACMAIEDAAVLARCLSTTPLPVNALRTYEALRYERTAFVTNMSWKVGRAFGLEGAIWCRLRNALMRRSKARMIRDTEALVGVEV